MDAPPSASRRKPKKRASRIAISWSGPAMPHIAAALVVRGGNGHRSSVRWGLFEAAPPGSAYRRAHRHDLVAFGRRLVDSMQLAAAASTVDAHGQRDLSGDCHARVNQAALRTAHLGMRDPAVGTHARRARVRGTAAAPRGPIWCSRTEVSPPWTPRPAATRPSDRPEFPVMGENGAEASRTGADRQVPPRRARSPEQRTLT
jgi:hypothetical protein